MINDKGNIEITEQELNGRNSIIKLLSGGTRIITSKEKVDILETLRDLNLCYNQEDLLHAYNTDLIDIINKEDRSNLTVRSLVGKNPKNYIYYIPDFPDEIGDLRLVPDLFQIEEKEFETHMKFDELE